jgi:gamma-glutamylcyclotransferase (GGCT)/AIG2-like uncharacterized protein YtfP
MNKDSQYAFYGTLRSGMENNIYYGAHALESLGIVELKGYLLFSLGEYPYAIKTPDLSKTIKAELFRINDKTIERDIHDMEISVEYYYDEVLYKSSLFGIYLFKHSGNGDILIEYGDWVKFKSSGSTF